MIALKTLGVLLFLIWAYCYFCYFAIKAEDETIKHLSFWQFLDLKFSTAVANGLKGLDILVHIMLFSIPVYMLWKLF